VLRKFIELCILLGCDYLEPIKGVGPKSALKLMKEHGSLKEVVEHIREKAEERADAEEDGKKKKGGMQIPDDWKWEDAKKLFTHADVTPADQVEVSCWLFYSCASTLYSCRLFQLNWEPPDVEGLVDFLVKDKGFKLVSHVTFSFRNTKLTSTP
jgi:flap endonuclease-1